jgi:hypothetical protein
MLLRVRAAPVGGVVFRVLRNGREIFVEVVTDGLRMVAWNLRAFAEEGGYSEHLRVEYFPEHFYLGESSAPVVVLLAPSDHWRCRTG